MQTTADAQGHATTGTIGLLNREWEQHLADLPLGCWAEGPLARFDSGRELLTWMRNRTSPECDEVLHALLTAQHDGHDQAGRLVLQAMLARVTRLGSSNRRQIHDNAFDVATSAMWEAIASYPLTRRSHVAAHLGFAVIRHLRAVKVQDAAELPVDLTDSSQHDVMLDLANHLDPGGHEPSATELVVHVIRWGLRNEVLSEADARMLVGVHCQEDNMAAYARRAGRSHAAVRKHHSRVIAALRQAVQADTISHH